MKRWLLSFSFPQLPGGVMYQSTTIDSDDPGVAMNRGFKDVRRRKAIKGRRISELKLTIVEIETKKEQASAASD